MDVSTYWRSRKVLDINKEEGKYIPHIWQQVWLFILISILLRMHSIKRKDISVLKICWIR